MKRSSSAGFTLVEMAVVIGILAIVAAMVIPAANAMRHRAQLSRALRELSANVKRARSLAASSMVIPSAGNPLNTTGADQRARFASLLIIDSRTYELRVDADADGSNNNELRVAIFQFDGGEDQAGLAITAPAAGNRILLASNGVRDTSSAASISVQDTRGGRTGIVQVSASGAVRIQY